MKYIVCLFVLAALLLTVEINIIPAKPKKIILDRVEYSQYVLKTKCEKVNTKAKNLDKKTQQAYVLLKELLKSKKRKNTRE